jgi:hypothetical protein
LTHKKTHVFDCVLPRNPQFDIAQNLRESLLSFGRYMAVRVGAVGQLSKSDKHCFYGILFPLIGVSSDFVVLLEKYPSSRNSQLLNIFREKEPSFDLFFLSFPISFPLFVFDSPTIIRLN